MTTWSYIFEILIIILLYTTVYNAALFIFFWNFHQFTSFLFKTTYSFSDFKFNFYFLISFTITLLSLAGVPPFTGFFAKVLILISLIGSNFAPLFFFFIGLLLLGLYFYVQNIKFLYATSSNNALLNYEKTTRMSSLYFVISIILVLITAVGPFFMDDFFSYSYWFFK